MDKMEEVDSRSRMLTNGGGPDQAGQVDTSIRMNI